MNDTYCEIIVKRKMTTASLLLRFVAVVVTTIVTLLGLMILNIYGLIVGFFLVWLDIIVFRNTDTEYEYQFISGDLDIDVIYGKVKRKKLKKYDMRKIEVLAPVKSDKLSSYNNNMNVKEYDFSSGYMDRLKYAFVIPSEQGGLAKIIFEPSEKMVNAIKSVSPSKVHMY